MKTAKPAAADRVVLILERLLGAPVPIRIRAWDGSIAGAADGPAPAPGPAAGRSPDEVRSMLSSYRTGIERGRTVAGGPDTDERPPDAS